MADLKTVGKQPDDNDSFTMEVMGDNKSLRQTDKTWLWQAGWGGSEFR